MKQRFTFASIIIAALMLMLLPCMSESVYAAQVQDGKSASTAYLITGSTEAQAWNNLKSALVDVDNGGTMRTDGESAEAPTYFKLAKNCKDGTKTRESRIIVASGRSVVLDLAGYTIDHGLAQAIDDGYVIQVKGNLTLRDSSSNNAGIITGGNSTENCCDSGGGVFVNYGTFRMEGGTITGNQSVYGGGVCLNRGSFTMAGGVICGNTASGGGGVYVFGDSFTMTGGTIKGNKAKSGGGGVCLDQQGTYTFTGGIITGNSVEKEYGQKGGGVYLDYDAEYTTLNISGNPVIRDNYRNGSWDETNKVYVKGDNGTADNLYIEFDSGESPCITLTGALTKGTNGANIGFFIYQLYEGRYAGTFTKGWSSKMGTANPADYFFCDDSSSVVRLQDGEATLIDHIHNFTYSANGATITAVCSNSDGKCPLSECKAQISLAKPAHEVYGDGAEAKVRVAGDTDVLGRPQISYENDAGSLDDAPTEPGTYTAYMSLGDARASIEYTIAPKPVSITGITAANKAYDGTVAANLIGTATVDGKVGDDDVSVSAGTAEFENANAGENKTVTYKGWSLTGMKAANYTLSGQPAAETATIEKRQITITASDQTVDLNQDITKTVNKAGVTEGSLAEGQSISEVTLTAGDAINTAGVHAEAIEVKNAKIVSGTTEVTGNYAITYRYGKLTVNKIKAVVTAAPVGKNNLTYTGSWQELLDTANATCSTGLEYSLDGTNWSTNVPKGMDARTYTVSYRAKADDNHIVGEANDIIVSIRKAKSVISEVPVAGAITYGQALSDSSLSGGYVSEGGNLVDGAFAWKTDTVKPSVADSRETEYGVVFTPTNPNYENAECKIKLEVKKADLFSTDFTAPRPQTLTYNGSDQVLLIAGSVKSGLGVMLYARGDDDAATETYTEAVPVATDIGTYKVWYMVKGDQNHNDVAPVKLTVEIGKLTYIGEKTVVEHIGFGESLRRTVDLPDIPEGAAYETDVTISGNSVNWINSATVSGNTLTYTTNAQSGPTTGSIVIGVRGANLYKDYDVTVIVSSKNNAGVQISGDAAVTKTYGDPVFTIEAIAESTDADGSWTFTSSNEAVATISATGQVTITGAGEALLAATYESDADWGRATITLTVNKATPNYETPQSQNLPCNATLEDISLPEHFILEEGNEALVISENTVRVRYTPEDTANYETVDDIAIKVILEHSLQKTKAAAATYEEAGNTAYFTCAYCGKHFSDENATTEIEKDSWVIPQLVKEKPTETDIETTTPTSSDKVEEKKQQDPSGQDVDKKPEETKDQDETPAKKGDVITDTKTGAEVKITGDSNKNPTAEYTGAADENASSLTVPDTVTAGGKTFQIVTIKANAFKNCKATKVTIGKNVSKIAPGAFNGSKVKTIEVRTKKLTKKSVKKALKGCKAKKVTLKVKVGKKKENKVYVKKYKNYFTKKNVGMKVTVK